MLRVLDRFEAFGPNKYINEQLQAAIVKNPKVAEFDTAIKAVLLNWIIGTAHSIIQHGVNNGFDDDRDNDHNHDSNDDSGDGDNWRLVEYKHANLNKRQRAKGKASIKSQRNGYSFDEDEAIRDAAATNEMPESDWTAINTQPHTCKDNYNDEQPQRKVRVCTQETHDVHNATCTRHDQYIHKASSPMPHATTIIVVHTHTRAEAAIDNHTHVVRSRPAPHNSTWSFVYFSQ